MKTNWAYDQFNTITVGNSPLGFVEVDMDGFSGKDIGFDHLVSLLSDEEREQARQDGIQAQIMLTGQFRSIRNEHL